ncbi:MAG: xylG [Fibrobacteria bacterium]|jgi:D-xylose transport system ATP-binding protein|nr:xylG [Fibrobacteria bacterium]
MLSARSLTMEYPGVKALNGVDFDLRGGEIHALCGENGAGKSTLIKILSGIIPHGRYGGHAELSGTETRFSGPGDALRAGIRVIHQELALCPDFNVAENIFLGAEPLRRGLIDTGRMEAEARRELAKLGLPDLDPRTPTGSLPVGIRQMVEIARALLDPGNENPGGRRGKVLILDEPTSALSAPEAERLEETLRGLRAAGYAILYISHRLDEVFRLADRVTVLQGGESRGTLSRASAGAPYDPETVVSWMVGETSNHAVERAGLSPAPTFAQTSEPVLSVRGWTVTSPANAARNAVENVSFDLSAGEILGVAGLMGAGRTELAESLCGLFPAPARGEIRVDGKPYVPRDARHAHAHGIALVCEDRRGHGVMPEKSVRANLTYASLRDFCSRVPGFGWLLLAAPERRAARAQIDALRVKTPDAEFPVGNLSGGNQQKTLIGRALLTRPRVLILDEPTRGIDVGAKAEIYALVQRLAAEGMAVLFISSENEEVLRLAHRVLVMRGGRIVVERRGGELDLDEALAWASGGNPT